MACDVGPDLEEVKLYCYLDGEGAEAYERCQTEAAVEHVFGVPMFVFRSERFWEHDRMPLLEERLVQTGLRR